jgi:hypothetical protein
LENVISGNKLQPGIDWKGEQSIVSGKALKRHTIIKRLIITNHFLLITFTVDIFELYHHAFIYYNKNVIYEEKKNKIILSLYWGFKNKTKEKKYGVALWARWRWLDSPI